MQTIYDLITLDVQNEHLLEHLKEQKKPYYEPSIYDAGGDLSKRWYIYYSYRNPETGKFERMKNIYGSANRYKTKADRYSVLNVYKKRLLLFLKQGYNPFLDNTSFHKKKLKELQLSPSKIAQASKPVKSKKIKPTAKRKKRTPKKETSKSIEEAFQFALNLKKSLVKTTTYEDYRLRMQAFQKWLKANKKSIKTIDQLNKQTVLEFLNHIQIEKSARTRNNFKTIFSAIFQLLEDNDIMVKNFMIQIKHLKTQPQRHKSYTEDEQNKIFDHLKQQDPVLLLFIKFISYSFMRPIEICRLRVKDIDLVEKTIKFQSKTKSLKTKIIPQILLDDIPDLNDLNPEHYLFTPDGLGAPCKTHLRNRRDYFSKQYKKVKDTFGFDENYGLYSFRHTFISKAYKALLKEYSPFEAKSRLMQITGHSSMTALEKYLRNIDADLPKDYSDLF